MELLVCDTHIDATFNRTETRYYASDMAPDQDAYNYIVNGHLVRIRQRMYMCDKKHAEIYVLIDLGDRRRIGAVQWDGEKETFSLTTTHLGTKKYTGRRTRLIIPWTDNMVSSLPIRYHNAGYARMMESL